MWEGPFPGLTVLPHRRAPNQGLVDKLVSTMAAVTLVHVQLLRRFPGKQERAWLTVHSASPCHVTTHVYPLPLWIVPMKMQCLLVLLYRWGSQSPEVKWFSQKSYTIDVPVVKTPSFHCKTGSILVQGTRSHKLHSVSKFKFNNKIWLKFYIILGSVRFIHWSFI